MGPTWGRQDPGGPRVGLMNLAIWDVCVHWRRDKCQLWANSFMIWSLVSTQTQTQTQTQTGFIQHKVIQISNISGHQYIKRPTIRSVKRKGRHNDSPVTSAENRGELRRGQQRHHKYDLSTSVQAMVHHWPNRINYTCQETSNKVMSDRLREGHQEGESAICSNRIHGLWISETHFAARWLSTSPWPICQKTSSSRTTLHIVHNYKPIRVGRFTTGYALAHRYYIFME